MRTKEGILSGLKVGDKKTIEYLYNKYKSLVTKRLKYLKASKEEIEDSYNEFFKNILLLSEKGKVPDIGDFSAYIIQSCNYWVISNREKQKKESFVEEPIFEQLEDQYDYEYDKFEQLALDKIACLSDFEKEIIHKSFTSESRSKTMSKYNLTHSEYYKEQKKLRENLISQILDNYEKNK